MRRRDDVQAHVTAFALEASGAHHEHTPDAVEAGQVERGRPRRADDAVGGHGRAHRLEPRHVVGPVVHGVVRHVDHRVPGRGASGQDRRDSGNRRRAAVDDAVEVDEEKHQVQG